MDSASLLNIANYTGLSIISATMQSNYASVLLKTNTIANGVSNTLTLSNLKDSTGNSLATYNYSFIRNSAIPNLVFTEVMYNSICSNIDTLDFVEIYNNSNQSIAIGGLVFNNGGDFVLPEMTIPANGFILLAEDSLQAGSFYGKTFLQYGYEFW